jgi:hypothetical protein
MINVLINQEPTHTGRTRPVTRAETAHLTTGFRFAAWAEICLFTTAVLRPAWSQSYAEGRGYWRSSGRKARPAGNSFLLLRTSLWREQNSAVQLPYARGLSAVDLLGAGAGCAQFASDVE